MAQQILNVSTPNSGLGDALRDASIKSNDNFTELYESKVDKVTGKDLSDNNLTDEFLSEMVLLTKCILFLLNTNKLSSLKECKPTLKSAVPALNLN